MTDAQLLAQRAVFRAAFGELLGLPQPVVAAVHGYALGGGCELALNCDLVVADETARVRAAGGHAWAWCPAAAAPSWRMRRLGAGRAADLVLTGRRVKAAEAERIGLADRLVPAGTAVPAALEMAGAIAANSPVAVRAAKRAMRQGWGLGLRRGAGHRGRRLADRRVVRGPARGHRGVQREARPRLAGRMRPATRTAVARREPARELICPRAISVREVGPRDGLQNEDPVPTEAKIELINALSQTGVSRIEAVSFVRPEAIPQMADADQVWEGITRAPAVRYSALAPEPARRPAGPGLRVHRGGGWWYRPPIRTTGGT